MKRIWSRVLLAVIALMTCIACMVALPAHSDDTSLALSQGLKLESVDTSDVYFSQNGKPLLSFGGMSDFIFYAAPDAFDYKLWADWAADHGMNHLRAYPPLSWKYIENFSRENGGSPENLLFPYEEVSPGSRRFDLTRFNENYWKRFREQCEYLQSKGIIIHLLMVNAWQVNNNANNWEGHFFNPENNANDFTDYLKDDNFRFYQSVSDQQAELIEAQKEWLRKIVETTADLDNVYYDLVHELAENYQDWEKAKAWVRVMAPAVRERFSALQPERPIILGMDTGGLEKRQREWIFRQPFFDVLIYGKSHKVDQVRSWRARYKKPYIPQESWDDNGKKYSLREPNDRVQLRKYLWKFMMAKCQQMDIYSKPLTNEDRFPEFSHNYDPNGWTPFEDDAMVLRQLWNQLTDYPHLRFDGRVRSGPGTHQYVLSSNQEGLVYLSSGTGKENVSFDEKEVRLRNLSLSDGLYTADVIRPDQGVVSTLNITVDRGRTSFNLPAFTDDLAVHLFRQNESVSQSTANESIDQPTQSNGFKQMRGLRILIGSGLAISAVLLALFFIKKRGNSIRD